MKKWIWIISLACLIILGFAANLYLDAVKPVKTAKEKAIEIAEEKADVKSIDNFTLFHGTDAYYIVEGKNSKKENVIVWINEKNNSITVKKKQDGISKKDAINALLDNRSPSSINTVRLGMVQGIPAWEIYTHSEDDLINYYYLDFETGEILLNIENI
ncbi:DUF5590 domain-containing protein [Niallia sp. NCCP-28]|uniref:cell wall elongation regulator TseB-like domain-containing protein n=1 Tax=Niallia sp. NCCP-28 TaxID=2934712 RepID=UPI002084F422|nr:DUF5590 domain-containing protein [Niallia sp. NCCP-28]GKU80980.1 hypothetical protein NCCP28_03760 [Niallia sp. NCCP-28]